MSVEATSEKQAQSARSLGRLVRRLRALEKRWAHEAATFHRMGKQMSREGNMAGNEYMQTAAAFRACASQLKQARSPNISGQPTPTPHSKPAKNV